MSRGSSDLLCKTINSNTWPLRLWSCLNLNTPLKFHLQILLTYTIEDEVSTHRLLGGGTVPAIAKEIANDPLRF